MPFTIAAHQAPVLPLKLLAPRWFDGTALVLGSMSPDLLFALIGTPVDMSGHLVGGLPVCVAVVLVMTVLVKRVVAGSLASILPDLGGFHLRDYALLGRWRWPRSVPAYAVLVGSAVVGWFAHVALDAFTHGHGWVVQRVSVLQAELSALPVLQAGRPIFVHDVLQVGLSFVGLAVTVWCLWLVGRDRLLLRWYQATPADVPGDGSTATRRLIVGWTVAGLLVGAAAGIGFADGGLALAGRLMVCGFAGLVLGCTLSHTRSAGEFAS